MAAPFSNSPLFRQASAQIRNQARQELRGTVLFRAFDEIQRCGRSGSDQKRALEKTLQKYGKIDLRRALHEISATHIGEVAKECVRYSRGGIGRMFLSGLFSALGDTGKILQELVSSVQGGSGLAREIAFAMKLLQSHGYHVIRPPGAGRQVPPAGTSLADFLDELRAQGYGIPAPENVKGVKPGRLPGGVPDVTTKGEPRRFVDLQDPIDGNSRRLRVNHPAVTGDFVRTSNSSTVYEIGYDITSRPPTLYVRFYETRKGGGKSKSPGPLYQYLNVSLNEFLSLYKVRNKGHKTTGTEHLEETIGGDASPGTWIWDHLRIRGTVSGHHKSYELVGVMGDYVPRQAKLYPSGERYETRTVMNVTTGKRMTSTLEPGPADSLVSRRLQAAMALNPSGSRPVNRGTPRRPNPGTPNRGRG